MRERGQLASLCLAHEKNHLLAPVFKTVLITKLRYVYKNMDNIEAYR